MLGATRSSEVGVDLHTRTRCREGAHASPILRLLAPGTRIRKGEKIGDNMVVTLRLNLGVGSSL